MKWVHLLAETKQAVKKTKHQYLNFSLLEGYTCTMTSSTCMRLSIPGNKLGMAQGKTKPSFHNESPTTGIHTLKFFFWSKKQLSQISSLLDTFQLLINQSDVEINRLLSSQYNAISAEQCLQVIHMKLPQKSLIEMQIPGLQPNHSNGNFQVRTQTASLSQCCG